MFFALLAASLSQATPQTPSPVVVELFTSQSCSSCPPAEAFFRELTARKDLVALEWHVDYWDELRHGVAGKWKDPHSSAANTQRQRTYNLAIRNTPSVYTPQAIINGLHDAVGSRRDEVNALIDQSRTSPQNLIMAISKNESHIFHLDPSLANAEILTVTFQKSSTTNVLGGENKGKKLAEAHIVTDAKIMSASSGWVKLSAPPEGYGCAILAQNPEDRSILAAAYCKTK